MMNAGALRAQREIRSAEYATDPLREEREESLQELIDSHGWREVAVPALRAHRAWIERQLATRKGSSIEEMRVLQGRWDALDDILKDAKSFFSFREEP